MPGEGRGEDVVIDGAGSVVTGLANGDIVVVEGDQPRILGNTGGRPLGIEVLPDGDLLVCDHDRGLVRFSVTTGESTVVVGEVEGEPLHFCSNAVVLADGTIYFSASSPTATVDSYRLDAIAHVTRGLFCRLDTDGTVTVLRRDLAFANGVAVSPDESFVLVAETIGYRVARLWLRGPRAGEWDVFLDGLGGFPDNISIGSDGLLWISLPTIRNGLLDRLLPHHPIPRRVIAMLPERLQPQPKDLVWVQAYDLEGNLVHDVETSHPDFAFVTAVTEHNGVVWLAAVEMQPLARFTVEA